MEQIAIYRKTSTDKLHKVFVYISIIDAFQVYYLLNRIFPNLYTVGVNIKNATPFTYEVDYVDSFSIQEYSPKTRRLKNIEDFHFTLN